MEENAKKNEPETTEEEEVSYDHEVVPINLGYMTRKEYNDLLAPEIHINEDYKNERFNESHGFKSKKEDKGRDMDR